MVYLDREAATAGSRLAPAAAEPVAWLLMPERKVLLDADYQQHKAEHHPEDMPLYIGAPAAAPKIVGYGRDSGKLVRVEVLDGTERADFFRPSADIVAPAECSCDDPNCGFRHEPLTLRQAYENCLARLKGEEAGWTGRL